MANQCVSPLSAAPFKFKTSMELVADAPISCSSKLQGDAIATCQSYTAWSGYTGSASAVLQGAADTAYGTLSKTNAKLAYKVYNGIGIGANIFWGANQQFIAAITDINAGNPYEPIVLPDNAPPFNPVPPSSGADAIEKAIVSFWNGFRPWLEKLITKMSAKNPNSPWIKILEGVVESSKLWIKQLQTIFSSVGAE